MGLPGASSGTKGVTIPVKIAGCHCELRNAPTGTSRKPIIKAKPAKVSMFGSTANLRVAVIHAVKMLPIMKPIAVP